MTITEIVTQVCNVTGQTDPSSTAQCKRFLNARLRMIWDSALWRDTLALVPINIVPGQSWIIMPAAIERVLKTRVNPEPLTDLSIRDYDPAVFEAAGDPIGFAVYAPVVHGPPHEDGDCRILIWPDDKGHEVDHGKKAFVEVEQTDGTRITEALVHTGDTFFVETKGRFIVRFSKEITTSGYAFDFDDDGDEVGLPSVVRIAAGEPQACRRTRIRLVRTPAQAMQLLMVCKRAYVSILNETENLLLTQAEGALTAYVTADMLERDRKYAKAQGQIQEAQHLIAAMHDRETAKP